MFPLLMLLVAGGALLVAATSSRASSPVRADCLDRYYVEGGRVQVTSPGETTPHWETVDMSQEGLDRAIAAAQGSTLQAQFPECDWQAIATMPPAELARRFTFQTRRVIEGVYIVLAYFAVTS